jgi:NhaA family Na+:H+ antiporter
MKSSLSPLLFQRLVAPLRAFLRMEATSGVLLFAAAVLAMAWANSPFRDTYGAVFSQPIELALGTTRVHFTVAQLINDGLMSVFFFLVGMEIKRELALGELRTPAKAMLPAIAAVGGMVVPAAIYAAFNHGGPGLKGWAIPMATDIAFCIGCMTLLKQRIPGALIVFVTALAIFDDMGGILVIALFYGHGLQPMWLAVAAGLLLFLLLLNRLDVKSGVAYAAVGLLLWIAIHHSGIHATIAGVLLGLMIPAKEPRPAREVIEGLQKYTTELVARPPDESVANEEILHIEERLEELEPPLNRFVHALHPWVAYGIMPLFALANSGIDLSGTGLEDLASPVLLGSAVGLFVGKQLGIFLFSFVAIRAGFSPMPGNAPTPQLYGTAVVAGIGFTVALFIAGLAFADAPRLLDQAKLGILLGSLSAGLVGYAVLRLASRERST